MTSPGAGTAVHIDITELYHTPINTGIQRVERELIRHWPGPARLVPVIAGRTHFHRLPDGTVEALVSGTPLPQRRLDNLFSLLRQVRPEPSTFRLVNPELFFDPRRGQLYSNLIRRGVRGIGWLLYDFLPWLSPQDFGPGAARAGAAYLRTLRDIPNVAHISAQTRSDYAQRIMRGGGREGPVISLGGDGLSIPHQIFSPARRRYVALGTIEPRKNVGAILEAFDRFWREGGTAELVVIGMMRGGTQREAEWIRRFGGNPKFSYLGHADDAALCEVLEGARALVFASRSEGFGLPPLEALHAGIPVIASAHIPSIAMLPDAGQIRLQDPSPDAILAAVRAMENDQTAARMWQETSTLHIRTWRDVAQQFSEWAQQIQVG